MSIIYAWYTVPVYTGSLVLSFSFELMCFLVREGEDVLIKNQSGPLRGCTCEVFVIMFIQFLWT